MLELRLAEHDSAVDYFVLVEGAKTFTGHPKPLFFEKHRERFAKWKDKIIYLVIQDYPEEMNQKNSSAWDKEAYGRDFAMAMLEQLCSPNDLVLHSDLDEIVSDDVLLAFKKRDNPAPHGLTVDFYYYNCNWKKNYLWNRLYIAQYADVKKVGIAKMRSRAGGFPQINGAGWHLSYFMTPEEIVDKIRAFSHTEVNIPKFTNLQKIEEAINSGKDLFDRRQEDCARATESDRLPKYIGLLPARYQRTE
jgi:beta-1,4-mannosyl-glycoprotein beta-1,4-N-acetylglucosaminyltransferase